MKSSRRSRAVICSTVVALLVGDATLRAHNGPPYPIVSNRIAGNYEVSLWADPDATDDGSADGRFWVTVNAARKSDPLPRDTQTRISIWPLNSPGAVKTATAEPADQEPSRRFAAFVIDHEGRYGVKATIDGPLGPAEVEAVVDAAYDQRPRPFTIVLFVMPFLLIGFVWVKLLMRRRASRLGSQIGRGGSSDPPSGRP
jgi:hypothetical protein